jgi:hypothetical protein
MCNCKEENHRHSTRLVVRMTSAFGSSAIHLANTTIAPGFSHWHSHHWFEAVVGGNTVVTWDSPIPRHGKECESVNDVRLRPVRVLDDKDDPLC